MSEFLRLLKGVKGGGNQYQALCPGHDDKTPSLSVSQGNGKILLHCHVGCTTENILGIMGLEMISSILYNLAAVTTAIKEKQPVLVVEGEKDCDNLGKYGFVATTCPMGAGKWHSRFSTMLKGGIVYIVADNDEPGNRHAQKVAKRKQKIQK